MRAHSATIVLAVALALGCGDASSGEDALREVELGAQSTAEAQPRPPERAAAGEPSEPRLFRGQRAIMGTVFQVTILGRDEARARRLIERALDEVERLDRVLSEWREDSEMSAINAAAGRAAPVRVGPDTLAVVRAGLDVSRWSGGAFDLSWAALRGLYTFQPGEERVPAIGDVRRRLARVDWRRIAVDAPASTVRLTAPGMAIGTGGIGKGYALDRAGDVLEEAGVESYMLFGGGQVQVHGLRGDRPWRVGIQHPRDPASYVAFLEVTDGSISTSGDYEHAFVDDEGRHWHHIIDLSTGLPATRSMQVTLLASDGMHADALSTAAFVLGPERALEMLSRVPGDPQAVIVGPDLRVYTTPGIGERLHWRVERPDGRLPGDPVFHGWRR